MEQDFFFINSTLMKFNKVIDRNIVMINLKFQNFIPELLNYIPVCACVFVCFRFRQISVAATVVMQLRFHPVMSQFRSLGSHRISWSEWWNAPYATSYEGQWNLQG